MEPGCREIGKRIAAGLAVLVWAGTTASALADGATRDLPDVYQPGALLSVSIDVDTPSGTGFWGLEDVPPSGWTNVSNISDGGAYDSENQKVKWPFFYDDLSRTVSYNITPPAGPSGVECFTGHVSFDGNWEPIVGDECVLPPGPIPATSALGLIVMGLLLPAAAALILRSRAQAKQRYPS